MANVATLNSNKQFFIFDCLFHIRFRRQSLAISAALQRARVRAFRQSSALSECNVPMFSTRSQQQTLCIRWVHRT